MPRHSHAAVVIAILLAPTAALAADKPFRFPEGKCAHGELKYVNGIPVVIVEGTPEEIGAATGVLGLKPGQRILDYPKHLMESFSAGAMYNLAVASGKGMVKQFPADYRTEMEAMARSSGAPMDKVVVGNTVFDIKKVVLCSALMVEAGRSSTGGPLLGRNLDYPSLDNVHEYTLVTVYKPKGKHAFVSIGFPGLVGCLSGMNDAGLTVAVLEVFGARDGEGRFNPDGIPYALCIRALLEECTTIAEAKKKLESLPRTTMLNLVVADRTGVATFEVTPKSVVLRSADRAICCCTNHFCTMLKPAKPVDMARSFDRFDSLLKTADVRDRLTPDDLRKKLDEVSLGPLTLQTMVFEPETLKLHLSFGKPPASEHPLHSIELRAVFK